MPQVSPGRVTTGATGDFAADAGNPLYREAELRVAQLFRDYGYKVEDVAEAHLNYDLVATAPGFPGVRLTIDVKCDERAWETGNLAWESEIVWPGGKRVKGWGQKGGADWICYALANGDSRNTWVGYLIGAPELQRYCALGDRPFGNAAAQLRGVTYRHRENRDGSIAHFATVPILTLERELLFCKRVSLKPVRTPPMGQVGPTLDGDERKDNSWMIPLPTPRDQ